MTSLKIVLGGAAMFALLFGIAIQRIPAAEPIKIEIDVNRDSKGAREAKWSPQMARIETNPVVTERILAPDAPARAPPVILVSDDGDTPTIRRHRRKLHMDICMRHAMHRVETHGGRSWRCRK